MSKRLCYPPHVIKAHMVWHLITCLLQQLSAVTREGNLCSKHSFITSTPTAWERRPVWSPTRSCPTSYWFWSSWQPPCLSWVCSEENVHNVHVRLGCMSYESISSGGLVTTMLFLSFFFPKVIVCRCSSEEQNCYCAETCRISVLTFLLFISAKYVSHYCDCGSPSIQLLVLCSPWTQHVALTTSACTSAVMPTHTITAMESKLEAKDTLCQWSTSPATPLMRHNSQGFFWGGVPVTFHGQSVHTMLFLP